MAGIHAACSVLASVPADLRAAHACAAMAGTMSRSPDCAAWPDAPAARAYSFTQRQAAKQIMATFPKNDNVLLSCIRVAYSTTDVLQIIVGISMACVTLYMVIKLLMECYHAAGKPPKPLILTRAELLLHESSLPQRPQRLRISKPVCTCC